MQRLQYLCVCVIILPVLCSAAVCVCVCTCVNVVVGGFFKIIFIWIRFTLSFFFYIRTGLCENNVTSFPKAASVHVRKCCNACVQFVCMHMSMCACAYRGGLCGQCRHESICAYV